MTINATKTAILAADASRFGRTVLIQNTGSVDVTLGIGIDGVANLTASVGVLLRAGLDATISGDNSAKAISGIVASGTGDVRATVI